jgi:hypothetical protein
LKFFIKRNLSITNKRKIKKFMDQLINSRKSIGKASSNPIFLTKDIGSGLKPGDRVRVRSELEILATLDSWNELKGCMFMDDQRQYCGTIQQVFKLVERFVDERDYRVKKAKGLVLLESLVCEGTPDYGRCDRACFYFWREEWLEKID